VERRRVLLSAFACAPDWGGEPAVGWQWALALAQRHDVTVVTHERFRSRIEAALAQAPVAGLSFHFLGRRDTEARMQRRVDSQAHYLAWQYALRATVRALLAAQPHDLLHQLTWGTWRLPCRLQGLGVPLVLGPVGGGDDVPHRAWMRSWPRAERLRYAVRSGWIALGRFDPWAQAALRAATLVLTKTEATRRALPAPVQARAVQMLELGCHPVTATRRPAPPTPPAPPAAPAAPAALAPPTATPSTTATQSTTATPSTTPTTPSAARPLHLLFAGRLIGGKGVVHAVDATLMLAARGLPVSLRLVGRGRLERWLRQRVASSQTPEAVQFAGQLPHHQMAAAYADADLLVFPSWHDASGNVVAEALAAGLPVLCLDCAGPRAVVDTRCAEIVPTSPASEADLVADIAARIAALHADRDRLAALSAGAIQRARELAWPDQVRRSYELIETRLGWRAAA